MPLPPSNSGPWPPKRYQNYQDRYLEHSAWFSGDPNRLADFYSGVKAYSRARADATGGGSGSGLLPSRHSLWRLNTDRFWARAITAPWRRQMLHIPIAADIATTSADLLFADPVAVRIAGARTPERNLEADATQDRLDELLEDISFQSVLTEAAETSAALGGVYLRVTWDKDLDPTHPFLTSVDSDQAVGEFQWGVLTAVTFWREVPGPIASDREVWRQLERHEVQDGQGYILHGVYKGTEEQLGEAMPLDLVPELAHGEWDMMSEYGQGVVETNIPYLTAVYVPNMRPNRAYRGAEIGRSDYDGVESLMDALDEVWTSWMRDVRIGRARLLVPEEYFGPQGKGKGAVFDLDQEIYEKLPMHVTRDSDAITPSQFAIRAADHLSTATSLMGRIVASSGYSESTFGLNEVQRGVTATEIISRERRSYVTRGKKVNYFVRPLREILRALLAIDRQHFGGTFPVIMPHVQFADAVAEDPGKMASTVVTLRQAMSASTDTLVRLVHNDWDEDQIQKEVARIMEEHQILFGQQSIGTSPIANNGGPKEPTRPKAPFGSRTGDATAGIQGPGEHLPPGSTTGGGGDGG